MLLNFATSDCGPYSGTVLIDVFAPKCRAYFGVVLIRGSTVALSIKCSTVHTSVFMNWVLLSETELAKLDPRLIQVLAYQRLQQLLTQTKVRFTFLFPFTPPWIKGCWQFPSSRSWVWCSMSFHHDPTCHSSCSVDLLQLFLGLPVIFFPCGFLKRAFWLHYIMWLP